MQSTPGPIAVKAMVPLLQLQAGHSLAYRNAVLCYTKATLDSREGDRNSWVDNAEL